MARRYTAREMERYDSLIFDLDGTLWNTTAQCAEAWNRVLSRRGVLSCALTAADMRRAMGLPAREFYEELLPGSPVADWASFARECFEEEIRVISAAGSDLLYKDVVEGLRQLRERFRLFIVSNCEPEYIDLFLDRHRLYECFEDVESHGATGKSKAQNITLIVQRNRMKMPAYIGDTPRDAASAGDAGVKFFQASYGFGPAVEGCPGFSSFTDLIGFFIDGQK